MHPHLGLWQLLGQKILQELLRFLYQVEIVQIGLELLQEAMTVLHLIHCLVFFKTGKMEQQLFQQILIMLQIHQAQKPIQPLGYVAVRLLVLQIQ